MIVGADIEALMAIAVIPADDLILPLAFSDAGFLLLRIKPCKNLAQCPTA